jgi:flagellum-specific peptidoglycan hydrolase FlgJ
MNMKVLSQKIHDYAMIVLFLLLVFLIGTYFPNDSVKNEIRQDTINQIKKIGFFEPKVNNHSIDEFITSMQKCIAFINLDLHQDQIIPAQLIIAQSIVESNFGTSRFAKEGNALFGVRVWSKNGILPQKQDPSINWRIKTYSTKCQSVKDYIHILNNNHHYKEFRYLRNKTKDPIKLADTLDNFSTSKEYTNHVKQILIKYKVKL